jgi:molybdenum cofactor cytidylyltransferase
MTDSVHCIVLAAGTSTRFGASKMLVDIGGEPMIRRVVSTVKQAALGPVHVVTGHDAERIAAAVNGLCDDCAHNPLYLEGMGTSIAAGIASLPADCAAAIIILGDQPLVSAAHLTKLLDTWQGQPHSTVASSYGETIGPPALFPNTQFETLVELRGDQGARALLRDPQADVVVIECDGPMPDVDTPDDLDALS